MIWDLFERELWEYKRKYKNIVKVGTIDKKMYFERLETQKRV
jgi:hypothetical protein